MKQTIQPMSSLFICSIFILLIIVPCSSSFPVTYQSGEHNNELQLKDFFDVKIRMLMFAGYTPSLAAGIIYEDQLIWSQGYGYYEINDLQKPTKDTIYHVASISKTMTATAILQLYEQGMFDLDDDVNNALPFSLRNPKYPNTPITFRMLLAHHASLHDHDEEAAYDFFAGKHPLSYIEELLVPDGEAYHPEFWGDNQPGTGGNYSNLGFNVLGYIVELLTNSTLEQYCQEHIFEPLHMHNTSFNINDLPSNQIADGYLRLGRIYLKIIHPDYTFLDPCGGLLSTVNDLSHFCIAHMNQGTYQNVTILNSSTIQQIHTIQYPDSPAYYGLLNFGLGWLIFEEEFDVQTQGHDGDIAVSHARMRIMDENTALIYLFNKGVSPGIINRFLPPRLEYHTDRFIRGSFYGKIEQIT